MELYTLEMPAKEAREAFLHYKHDVEKRRKQELDKANETQARLLREDEELMAVYRVMSRGRRVINFTEACANLGWKEDQMADGLPQIAICQAAAARCALVFPRYSPPLFIDEKHARDAVSWNTGRIRRQKATVGMSRDLWDKPTLANNGGQYFSCKVPVVPLRFRPAVRQLKNYHLIFEAEWDLTAPLDPFLVKRISENFFAIVAQWDLSPIERSLVGMR